MTKDQIRKILEEELSNVAPETLPAEIDDTADLREALDIDSMSFLAVITALHKRLKVNVPEADYRQLFTKRGAVDYLYAKLKK
jgi:acyl carrier protein